MPLEEIIGATMEKMKVLYIQETIEIDGCFYVSTEVEFECYKGDVLPHCNKTPYDIADNPYGRPDSNIDIFV
jgi:hypothetical protein